MAQHPVSSFPMSALFLAVAAVALLFTSGLSFWFLLLVTELIAIYVCVELMTQRMPAALRSQSEANCYRLDGTCSYRRSSRERKSLRRVRSDLWAAFLIVAFIGTGGLLFFNTQVLPPSLAAEVVSAFGDNPSDFKSSLQQRHVDRKYFHWAHSTSTKRNDEIAQQARLLWMTWPVFLILAITSFVACVALIRYAYFRTLREFHEAVMKRANEYLNVDTRRLQE